MHLFIAGRSSGRPALFRPPRWHNLCDHRIAGMAGRFRYLNIGLGVILAFVGIKMLIVDLVHLPTFLSLAVIAVVLTVTILTSLRAEKRDELATRQ